MCAANVSEGRDAAVLGALRSAVASSLLDVHVDGDHHRAVLTLAGDRAALEDAVAALATVALAHIDLRAHEGVHPRLGALDVVPFAPVQGGDLGDSIAAREATLARLGRLGIPSFRYGPLPGGEDRTLPEVRRGAFRSLAPDAGPAAPHPTGGASAVGARLPLVAWNVWLAGVTLARTSQLAAAVRGDGCEPSGSRSPGRPS